MPLTRVQMIDEAVRHAVRVDMAADGFDGSEKDYVLKHFVCGRLPWGFEGMVRRFFSAVEGVYRD